MKNICIIGAGGTGCTMAADMVLKGHEVTLYADPAWQGALEEVRAAGGIRMIGQAATGFAPISRLENDLERAVRGADVDSCGPDGHASRRTGGNTRAAAE